MCSLSTLEKLDTFKADRLYFGDFFSWTFSLGPLNWRSLEWSEHTLPDIAIPTRPVTFLSVAGFAGVVYQIRLSAFF